MDRNPNVGIAGGKFKMFMLKRASLVYKLCYLEHTLVNYFYEEGNRELIGTGTGGSIFRTEVMKKVGGFDKKIKGAGEDVELAYRIKMNGWNLWNTKHEFYDVPESDTGWKKSWRSVWNHYFWYGYNYHYVYHKHPIMFKLYFKYKTPFLSLLMGVHYFFLSLKLTQDRVSMLLPLFFFFRQVAWIYAFTKAHLNDYEPK